MSCQLTGEITDNIGKVSISTGYFSIDVECVAVGRRHNDRAVGQIALVDNHKRVLLDVYVKPEKPVVSYLTPLSGLTKEKLKNGISLETALNRLRSLLPSTSILVGQSIRKDVMWCKLKEGTDFRSTEDLAELYKVYSPRYRSWSRFSLEHLSKVVLGSRLTGAAHNAADDAINSIRLYKFYLENKSNSGIWNRIQNDLLKGQRPMSFSKRHPTFEGVCMGNKQLCRCGEPFVWF